MKLRSARGMTMAEMLITVAIIIILMGVGFIALINYQRSLAQIERDGYAKELFIAAQNHLTMAKGNGYGLKYNEDKEDGNDGKTAVFGTPDGDNGVRYLVVNEGVIIKGAESKNINVPAGTGTMMDVMLPFGAIEETVRSGGSYVIRYQPSTGIVMDVFYVTRGSGRFDFDHDLLKNGEYDSFKALAVDGDSEAAKEAKAGRRSYGKAVLGWYGGEQEYRKTPDLFKNPSISVTNNEVLRADVINGAGNESAPGSSLKIIITGKISGGKRAFYLRKSSGPDAGTKDSLEDTRVIDNDSGNYGYVLDRVSASGEHFCELAGDSNGTELIPGEDIEIKAVAYSRTTFANIAYSEIITENSLFESIADNGDGTQDSEGNYTKDPTYTASIGYFRHLENLEEQVSGRQSGVSAKISIKKALQTRDMIWPGGSVYDRKATSASSTKSYAGYRPVSPDDALLYDGLRHTIRKVNAVSDENGYAGIFGSTAALTEIRNIRLIDINANGSEYAGALAGILNNAKVSNVTAYNTLTNDDYNSKDIVSGANAGGLAGGMIGGSVLYSSASLIVDGGSFAGGLIGQAIEYGDAAPVIRACYSGGHTDKGTYYKDGDTTKDAIYNITSNGYAGGLLGNARSARIRYCYSTCSAKGGRGNKDGGFAGLSSGARIYDCYSTGLVYGDHAFVGEGSASLKRDLYYSIINEIDEDSSSDVEYKEPVSWTYTDDQIKAVDKDANTFNTFTGGTWNSAKPYDSTVKNSYNGKYSFRTVTQLVAGSTAKISFTSGGDTQASRGAYFVNTHYGDWPAPEVFIINP